MKEYRGDKRNVHAKLIESGVGTTTWEDDFIVTGPVWSPWPKWTTYSCPNCSGTGVVVEDHWDTTAANCSFNVAEVKDSIQKIDRWRREPHYDPRPRRRVGRERTGNPRALYGHAGRVYQR